MEPDKLQLMLEGLMKANQALTETITARFAAPDPAARKAETDALVETVLAKMSAAGFRKADPVRKMVWATPGKSAGEGEKLVTFRDFMKAVASKDTKFLHEFKAPNGQDETDNADGLYTVPVEAATEIIKLERAASIAARICREFPMGSKTRTVPKQLTNPTVTWTDEGTNHTKTKVTFDRITQTAKKVSALIPMSEEWLEDDGSNTDQFIFQVVAEAIARDIDKNVFVGDVSGLTDPFNGVFFATGVNSVSLDGASLAYDDLVNLLMAPKAPYRERSQFVLSTTALKKIMKLKDDDNKPIWTMPIAGNPGLILGKRYHETDQIPDTLGTTRTNGANTAILCGAWDAVWMSPRGGYTVKGSDSASDANGGAGSAFLQDEIWFKFRRRISLDVANAEALAKLAVPAA